MSVEDGDRFQQPATCVSPEDKNETPVADFDTSAPPHRDMSLSSDIHLAGRNAKQLPSPSPTPSPRSSSPSLAVAEPLFDSTEGLSSILKGGQRTRLSERSNHDSRLSGKDEVVLSPLPSSKHVPAHELHDIPEEKAPKPRKLSTSKSNGEVLKLSAAEMEALTSAPESLPLTSPAKLSASPMPSLAASPALDRKASASSTNRSDSEDQARVEQSYRPTASEPLKDYMESDAERRGRSETTPKNEISRRPGFSSRTISTPISTSNSVLSYTKGIPRQLSPRRQFTPQGGRPEPLDLNSHAKQMPNGSHGAAAPDQPPSPVPQSIPLPPMSIPTYLQLELSSSRPSPLYIYPGAASESPFEASKIKFERLLNFLLLPPQLEQVLYFGSLACLDAWVYTFTILPLRFFKAAAILIQWWGEVLAKEARFILGYIYHGAGRFWHRQRDRRGSNDSSSRSRSVSRASRPTASTTPSFQSQSGRTVEAINGNGIRSHFKLESERRSRQGWGRKHRRMKSEPSSLSANHKADLLQGAVIVCSCLLLMKLDASRMYHNIRGQSAIKLYVIYNALEVGQSASDSFLC